LIVENELVYPEGIRAYGNCNNSFLICNSHNSSFYGDNFEGPGGSADVGHQLPNFTPTGNTWANTISGGFSLNGNISPAIHWYYNGIGTFIPTSNLPPSSLIPGFIESINNPDYCGLLPLFQTPIDEREKKMGKIVRHEKVFDNYPDEFSLFDEFYTYKHLFEDSTLLNLGSADDSLYQAFYGQMNNSNAAKFIETSKLIEQEDLLNAMVVNNSATNSLTWEYNQKFVNQIYLEYKLYDSIITSSDTIELMDIAYQNSAIGGPGVIAARALLKLEIEDFNNLQSRNATIADVNNSVAENIEIYPNPNNGEFTILSSQKEIEEISILDITGKIIYSKNSSPVLLIKINVNLPKGIYLLRVRNKDEWITEKMIIE